jgi:myosin-5
MENLYSKETQSVYVEKLIKSSNTAAGGTDVRATLAPHVYETSSLAYRGLAIEGRHQSILVSGESGAGKTETVKIVMSHLASVQSAAVGHGETEHHHLVVQRVLDSHPLLEAFGNAKTVRNDNSSRFGKFIQMEFDVEDSTTAQFSGRAVPNCVLAGSTCETYLLEKSRVVGHEAQERTYHIFYQLLAAPEETKTEIWQGLANKSNQSFRYVGATDTTTIEGKSDAERWERTIKALEILEIAGDDLQTLLRALCVVLQLGNLVFDEDPDDSEKTVISSNDELSALSELIGVDIEHLEKALTHRTVVAGKESYTVPLKVAAARDGCDAFAKEIYQQSFDWLVRQINSVTCAEQNYDEASDVDEYGLIGLVSPGGERKISTFGVECADISCSLFVAA